MVGHHTTESMSWFIMSVAAVKSDMVTVQRILLSVSVTEKINLLTEIVAELVWRRVTEMGFFLIEVRLNPMSSLCKRICDLGTNHSVFFFNEKAAKSVP